MSLYASDLVGIINYGMGNLSSVYRAVEKIGYNVILAEHPKTLFEVSRVILPGVGAFSDGMDRLRTGGWIEALQQQVEKGKPLLGICLGMQMLSSVGEENGLNRGLNFIPGKVRRLDKLGCPLHIPHVGWNEINHKSNAPLFHLIPQATDFYFIHSYAFDADNPEDIIATTNYAISLTAAVQKDHVFGTQFHPEKSSKAGLQILKNFLGFLSC